MHDLLIVLRAFALIAWNFSPVIGAFLLVEFYAYITRKESPDEQRDRHQSV